MNSLGQKCFTLSSRALCGPRWYAIAPVVEGREGQTRRRFTREEVIRIGEIFEPRKLADSGWNRTSKEVVRHIELLQTTHASEGIRQWPHQLVKAQIQHSQVLQQPYLSWNTRSETIVHEDNLIQIGHVAEASWYAAMESVVS